MLYYYYYASIHLFDRFHICQACFRFFSNSAISWCWSVLDGSVIHCTGWYIWNNLSLEMSLHFFLAIIKKNERLLIYIAYFGLQNALKKLFCKIILNLLPSWCRTARDIIFQANDYGKRRFEYWILVEFGYDSSQNLSKPQFTTGCQIQYNILYLLHSIICIIVHYTYTLSRTFHFLCSNL